jgi:uncharacterized membrane protein (DUF2068 family)
MSSSHNVLIRLVALFKLLKAALLIVAGIGILRLMHTDVATQLDHWVSKLGLDPGGHYLDHAIQKTSLMPPNKFKEIGFGSFVYAGLFLTEGTGLWLEKRWAEWFTVAITSSLVPLEVYEIYRHATAVKIVVLILNVAIVGYLLYRIFHESGSRQGEKRGDRRLVEEL